MNSIKRAREAIHRDACTNANLAEAFGAGGDALIAETLDAVFDAIESELEERYMELPVDADGVPIHIGDLLVSHEYNGKKFQCIGINVEDYGGITRRTVRMNYDSYSGTSEYVITPAIRCHHVNPRKLEDVLSEFRFKASCIYDDPNIGGKDRVDALESLDEEFALEIRAMKHVNCAPERLCYVETVPMGIHVDDGDVDICSNCRVPIDDDSYYCSNCGARIVDKRELLRGDEE